MPLSAIKNTIIHGDCLAVMKEWPDNCIDNICTDPPYALNFMSKKWDASLPSIGVWEELLRVCKPGAILMAFGGTRTYHRLTCVIEDAGWEIRDCLLWVYASGFPKSLNISKAIDQKLGAEREVVGKLPHPCSNVSATVALGGSFQKAPDITLPATLPATLFDGYGSALKPAYEPIVVAMKPLDGTYAENALKWGVAGLNIDTGRIPTSGESLGGGAKDGSSLNKTHEGWDRPWKNDPEKRAEYVQRRDLYVAKAERLGRWPANVILDEEAARMLDEQSGILTSGSRVGGGDFKKGTFEGQKGAWGLKTSHSCPGSKGGASRFFYIAKAPPSERDAFNTHPTVKPIALMRYLLKLLAAPNPGIVLDPFCGSGSTCIAARSLNIPFVGIELDEHSANVARERLNKRALPLFDDEHETTQDVREPKKQKTNDYQTADLFRLDPGKPHGELK